MSLVLLKLHQSGTPSSLLLIYSQQSVWHHSTHTKTIIGKKISMDVAPARLAEAETTSNGIPGYIPVC